MSELFRSIAAEQLVAWVFSELEQRDAIFGIPRKLFFVPQTSDNFQGSAFGQALETPFGPAAGPHTQMAQNIVAAWLCGARYIELKTVQTLDELDVSKPCIDMQDEGYNVEWSQELKVYESFDEYLRAWVLIHALHRRLGFPGDSPGVVFNMSVGYDLAGIQQPNVQWFLDQMEDCSNQKERVIEAVATHFPQVRDLHIPDRISDNVTLSTMHGCPPQDVASISGYLLRERNLHTLVKLNPTLLGADRVRGILNNRLGYEDICVPDAAFEHDLAFDAAVPMLQHLQDIAKDSGRQFGVKLTNTLEVDNTRDVFKKSERTSYLSGRPLHAISINLADELAGAFDGGLPMSFSAGVNAWNASAVIGAGMQTVTACSDLLKTGGYLRLRDYIEQLQLALDNVGATSIDEFIRRSAGDAANSHSAARANLRRYADRVLDDRECQKGARSGGQTKTGRALGLFDCIAAPCVDACPLGQQVPRYMSRVSDGDFASARRVVDADNPLPSVLGRICDHQCETVCVRNHLDEPLAIRDIKRFITDQAPRSPEQEPAKPATAKVAIIGAGPGGLSAALELARGGCRVEVFEQHGYAGGMVGGVVPEYRLPRSVFERDLSPLQELGVVFHYHVQAGRDVTLRQLRKEGFDAIVLMIGAQLGRRLGLDGEDSDGVMDALQFLRQSKKNEVVDIGPRVGVIGAGDTAMDCARTAQRLPGTEVCLIYRRGIDQMPADAEEIEQLVEEGVRVIEFAKPVRLVVEGSQLRGVECRRTAYSDQRDASGRKQVKEINGADFTVELDTMILAISQRAELDFFDGEPVAVNDRGYIRTDPVTYETSVPGIYAGGDVANGGPETIVKAAAAGRAIAASILRRKLKQTTALNENGFDLAGLLARRGRRLRRERAETAPLASRDQQTEVMLTYADGQARGEAERCFECDLYCSICVGVCPNLALQTFRTSEAGRQQFQVVAMADLCNECGNCTTFCPASGRPFSDKPRLYLNLTDFEAQDENAFMVTRNGDHWGLDARWDGETRHVELGDKATDEQSATMHTLLDGLHDSLPFLPVTSTGAEHGRVGHPGYEE
jgi:putative selenate reductase